MATPERIIDAAAHRLTEQDFDCAGLSHYGIVCGARLPDSPYIWCNWCLATMLRAVVENFHWTVADSPEAAAERAKFEKEQGQ